MVREHDAELSHDLSPVTNGHLPVLCDIRLCKPKKFQQRIIMREYLRRLCNLSELAIEILDRICRVDSFENRLRIAEEKRINGIIDDTAFTKIKVRYREQIEGIEDEIHKVDQTKNLKIDVIQDVLALMRNIGKTYEKATN